MHIKKTFTQSLAAVAATALLVTSAQAALVGRDINGVAVLGSSAGAVFLYDTDLNITWLRDANINGQMTWNAADAWATNLVVGAYSGWRLPTMVDTAAPGCDFSVAGGSDCGYNVQTKSGTTVYSEMAHLYLETLGNKALCTPGDPVCSLKQPSWGLANTGDFQNMQADFYWLGLDYAPDTNYAWEFSTNYGYQGYFLKSGSGELYAMAVRAGDVAATRVTGTEVPEPGTLLLAALALAGMGVVRTRRAPGASAL